MAYGRKPTKAEQSWLDSVRAGGCIVCRLEFDLYSPCVPHHISGTTKEGVHFKSFGLCFGHHQEGSDKESHTSRHPWKAQFELRYGKEEYLLEKEHELLGI